MEYRVFKLNFRTGVHLGRTRLEDAEYQIHADTLFSALCQEYMKLYDEDPDLFVKKFQNGELRMSDAFPYLDDNLYLPKPMVMVKRSDQSEDSKTKKAFKNLKYIPVHQFDRYLDGNLDAEAENHRLKSHLGTKEMRQQVAIRGNAEPEPFRTGVYRFKENAGLYLILGYCDDEDYYIVSDLLESLGYSGIGGKRSSGLGKFDLSVSQLPDELKRRLQDENYQKYMTLCVALPQDRELDDVLEEADYKLLKRSGFVQSDSYANEAVRKNDLFVFPPGSCFTRSFQGDIYDVGKGGNHPVYRYAMPLMLGVM